MQYVVVFEPTGNGFSAYVPDLPGCIAAAETREEVEQLIGEAIDLHIELMREGGEPIPEPGVWTKVFETAA
jgi:predicted RNase H-like HicB family nuclease